MSVDERPGRGAELLEELKAVLLQRGGWVDSLLPPVVFVILNAWLGFPASLWGALGVALLIAVVRLVRRQDLRYVLGGVAGVAVSALIAWLVGGAQGYFLPGILTGALTALLSFVSVVLRRPLTAWTSHLARRWPLAWYWQPQVRPAYSEVTVLGGIFFAVRALGQYLLFQGP